MVMEDVRMQIGVVGLGRMGANISRRLTRAGHSAASTMRFGFGGHVEPGRT
jgi:prephenate dehydrogenase